MRTRSKIITVNIIVVFTTILTLVAGAFSVVMHFFAGKDSEMTQISVAADNKITFKKTGLLDLIENGGGSANLNPISISTKEEAIKLYNDYLDDYFNTGKVRAISQTVVSGGGSLGGMSATYVGLYNEELYSVDGAFISDGVYCKIPNAKGDDDGPYAPNNFIERIEVKDGIKVKYCASGGKEVCDYVINNGKYEIVKYVTDLPFDYQEKAMDTSLFLIPFLVNSDTITNVEIDDSFGFIIKVKYSVKDSALADYKQIIKDSSSDNKGLPTFHKLDFEVSFNKYTGDIVQISKYEEYTMPNKVAIMMQRNSQIVFKKED